MYLRERIQGGELVAGRLFRFPIPVSAMALFRTALRGVCYEYQPALFDLDRVDRIMIFRFVLPKT